MAYSEPTFQQLVPISARVFIEKHWPRWLRTDELDFGFQIAFRDFMSRQGFFERIAGPYDLGFGLNLRSRSGARHEVDFIGFLDRSMCVFEAKHYPGQTITKEIVSEFFWKSVDFYLANPALHERDIRLFLVTLGNLDDGARRTCISTGVTVIELGYYSSRALEFYVREMEKAQEVCDFAGNAHELEVLSENVNELVELGDFSLSQMFVPAGEGRFDCFPLPPDPNRVVALFFSANMSFRSLLEQHRTHLRAQAKRASSPPE